MKTKTQSNVGAGFADESVETFLSVAGIYLDSSERLVELTIAANRQALDDFVAQSRKHSSTGAQMMAGGHFDPTHMQPMMERTISYSRSVMEVLMDAQINAAKTLGQHMNFGFPALDQWSKAMETMSEGIREVSERGAEAAESQVRSVTEAVTKASKAA